MYEFHRDFSSVTSVQTAARIVNLRETFVRPRSPRLRAMPLLMPPTPAQPAHGEKRRLAVIGLAVALVLAGVAVWSAARPDSYGQSRAGCVTVTIASSTGGALLHGCGARARHMCRSAFGRRDRLSLLIRPSCRSAGLSKAGLSKAGLSKAGLSRAGLR
jgi:hypothetical protein